MNGILYEAGNFVIIFLKGGLLALFWSVLIKAAKMDYHTQTIDNRIHLIIALLGIAAVFIFPEYTIWDKCIGALAVSVPMFLITILVPGAFGGGDIKLMAACGWFLGTKSILYAAVLAFFACGIYCAVMLAAKKMKRKQQFAFGPWLVFGIIVSSFYGSFCCNAIGYHR